MDPVFLPLANSRLPSGSKLSTYLNVRSPADPSVLRDSMTNGMLSPTHPPLKPVHADFPCTQPSASPSTFRPLSLSSRPLSFTQPPPVPGSSQIPSLPPPPPPPPPPSVTVPQVSSRVLGTRSPVFRSSTGDAARDPITPAPSSSATAASMYFYKRDTPPITTATNAKAVLPPGGKPQQQQQLSAAAASFISAPPVSMSREYVADEVRQFILQQQLETDREPSQLLLSDLPEELDNYHQLYPLEPPASSSRSVKSSTFGGCLTTCYKATNIHTGQRVCLRRVHGHRLSSTKAVQMVSLWSRVKHTSLVSLRELFTTKSFGDNSVVFVYDYLPCVETLISRHFSRTPGRSLSGTTPVSQPDRFSQSWPMMGRRFGSTSVSDSTVGPFKQPSSNVLLPENLLWSYIIQLTGALRVIHSAGLACRVLDPSKVLVSGADRVHLNGCGVLDVLLFDGTSMSNTMSVMPHYQLEDLLNLGKLLLVLACSSLLAIQRDNINTSITIVERNYSSDLKTLIVNLLMCGSSNSTNGGSSSSSPCSSIADVMPLIGARFYVHLDSCQRLSERLTDELHQTVGNSQLMRILAKLIVLADRHRPDDVTNEQSEEEIEDSLLLAMFKHYMFHAVTETDQPFLQLSHVVSALNKLQAGSHEKICLMSGDTLTVMVVSYAELREAFERAQLRLVAKKSPA